MREMRVLYGDFFFRLKVILRAYQRCLGTVNGQTDGALVWGKGKVPPPGIEPGTTPAYSRRLLGIRGLPSGAGSLALARSY